MGPSTARLEVDGHYRDACAWRRLGGRCALSASAGEAAALAAYAADLARPRDGRPYGKAAVLARDAAGAVAACVARAADGSGAVCLFATRTEPRPLELRVLNDDGSVASSLRVAGAAPASLGDALVVRNDGYTRDAAVPRPSRRRGLRARGGGPGRRAEAPRLRRVAPRPAQVRRRAPRRRPADGLGQGADDGGSVEVWFERDRGAPPPAPRDRGTQHETRIYHMRRFNNWVKSELIRKAAAASQPPGGPLSVLDLACGKGGDLSKWANAKPTNYVGVDIAKQSLTTPRAPAGMGNKLAGVPCRLVEASLGNTSLVDGESAFATWDGSCDGGAWSSRPRRSSDAFHVAPMQFAIHYMFETRPRAEALFRDLGLALRAGGRFLRDGDDALAVDSPEWLAPLPVLQELAQAAGLELIRGPLPAFLELRRGEDPAGFARSVDKMGVPDRAGSLSPAE
ncbi:mRNA (guanine-N7-)-methyltransferase [Aureococcus anophagefferens]|nr:mRNA (guanine-N7-)-methyltransferase [Aureococcus anophagefferens]